MVITEGGIFKHIFQKKSMTKNMLAATAMQTKQLDYKEECVNIT